MNEEIKTFQRPSEYFQWKAQQNKPPLIGAEFEHLILNQDNSWVKSEEVAAIMDDLVNDDWQMETVERVFLGLRHECMWISLEPGSQFEISIRPLPTVNHLEKCYRTFLEHVLPIIHKHGKKLVGVGFQPITRPDDIELIDKKRYHYMNQHFSKTGTMGYYMMRASAASQMAVDYFSEQDFVEKLQFATRIGPYLALMFDSVSYVHNQYLTENLFRTTIWNNTDDQRSNTVRGGLEPDFGFEKYTKHILNFEPVVLTNDQKTISTGHKKTKDLIRYPVTVDLWEHFLSMAFFDVRAKGYLEIRMIDSVPYPYNLAAVALIKGIMYHPDMNKLHDRFRNIDQTAHEAIKRDLIEHGYQSSIYGRSAKDVTKLLYQWGLEGLTPEERPLLEVMKGKVERSENFRYPPTVSLEEAIRRNEVRL